jgi:Rod binding domain-containing protein
MVHLASTAPSMKPDTATVSAPLSPSPKLVNAAHEFEASLMKELMAPLLPGHDLSGEDEEGSASALGEFAGEALAKAISEHGGFGIASGILRQLSSQSNHFGNSVVPEHLIETPPISPS